MIRNIVNVKIKAQSKNSYPIIIGSGLFSNAGEIISKYVKFKKAVVITNTTVYRLYGEKFNFDAEYIIIEDGEEFKNFATYEYIQKELIKHNITRKDCIIALGGGVVGDIAGFAAATYMRGIGFVQVPTTILAQVDSSVGGKVAINLEAGKNLVGAFYQPKLVLTDIDTLTTLDERQLKSGLGEVLKYAFIEKNCKVTTDTKNNREDTFFNFLKKNKRKIYELKKATMTELIKQCCKMKAAVVNADEKENGIRAVLNFGHTFAHAIEQCTSYKTYTHGEAVSIGMKMAFDLSEVLAITDAATCLKAKQLIDDYRLNYNSEIETDEKTFFDTMTHDKKNSSEKIRFVLAKEIGKTELKEVNEEEVIRKVLTRYVGKKAIF